MEIGYVRLYLAIGGHLGLRYVRLRVNLERTGIEPRCVGGFCAPAGFFIFGRLPSNRRNGGFEINRYYAVGGRFPR